MRNRAITPMETTLNSESFCKETATPSLPKPIRASSFKDAQNLSTKSKENDPKSKKRSKKAFMYFCTNFGTIIFSLIYVFLGAYLFQILEKHESTALCQKHQAESRDYLDDYKIKIYNYLIYNVTFNPILNVAAYGDGTELRDGPETYNKRIESWLIELRDRFLDNQFGGPYDKTFCEDTNEWEFLNSLLFSISVLTTIGYGHIAPKSWEGQIILICYSLLGTPFFIMTVAKLSFFLADGFIFFYKNIFCFPCALYSVYVTEYEEENEEAQVENQDCDFIDAYGFYKEDKREEKEFEIEDEEEETTKIPIFIIFGLLILYMIIGMYLFYWLESDSKWTLVNSLYFTFVSFSTIGFGDFTPGVYHISRGNHSLAARNLTVGCIFIVIGMTVLGMSLSLMQEGFIDNLRALLKKIGIQSKINDTGIEESNEIVEYYPAENVSK